jgi:hypothetical protein
MFNALLLVAIVAVSFTLGYGVRALISAQRREIAIRAINMRARLAEAPCASLTCAPCTL